jgi:DNA-binding MarR family transcriptional regulator
MPSDFPSVPPPAAEAWTGYLFHWVHRKLEIAYLQNLQDLHLSLMQVAILQYLSTREGRNAMEYTQARVISALAFDKGSGSREVRNLEEQGLITRAISSNGRRASVLALSPKGRDRLHQIESRNDTVSREVFRSLSPSELGTLHELLRRVAVDLPLTLERN